MILCIGATPALQRVMIFPRFTLDAVNRSAKTLDGVAGKSVNVAKVLKALGEQPVAVGFLGGQRGEVFLGALSARGIPHEFVTIEPETRQCITVIDQAAGTTTELVQESSAVGPEAYERLGAVVRNRLPGCRVVVLSGTLTPSAPVDFYRRCAELANAVSILTVMDAQGPPLLEALKGRPGLVKPNRAELAATTDRALDGEEAVIEAMRDLHSRGAQRVVVTAGAGPALAFDGRRFWRIMPPRIRALNPIGSGDAFTASLTSRLARGDDLGEACRWGAAAGAANALTWMAGELEAKEVERLAPAVTLESLSG
jgi:tagatose 6-phosphate kinase